MESSSGLQEAEFSIMGGLICFAGMDMAYAEALQDKKDLTRRV